MCRSPFCAALAWSRFRFVRFAADERSETTLAMLAECFEVLGGVPGKVLADRMGCLKGGVVANVVVPTGEYARFAGHYGFRPDSCEAADPESKGVAENLVGYAKSDLVVPQAPFGYFAVRHRTRVAKGPGSKAAGLAMAYKLSEAAQRRWRAVNAPHLVTLVRAGAVFVNGKLIERPENQPPTASSESPTAAETEILAAA